MLHTRQLMSSFVLTTSSRLPRLMNRKFVDEFAVEFCMSMNTKANRKKLARALFSVDKNRYIPYLLDQSPLSNCRHTSGRAERNSCRSQILAVANIQVAYAHVNKPRARMAISNEYTIGTRTHTVQRSSAFLRRRGRSSCEIVGRKQ